MSGRRRLSVVCVAAMCAVASAPASAASGDRARVAVTGAVHRTYTNLRGCESVALARRLRVLALRFGPRPQALLTVRISAHATLRDASVDRVLAVSFAVARDRNWAAGPLRDGHGHVVSAGTGTVSASAGGRTGTLHATLAGTRDAGTRDDPRAPVVHVDATWRCAHIGSAGASGS